MRDRELAASIVDGDPDALAEAYDKYADLLWSYCRSLVSDADEAAEAVADTFVITAARLEVLPALGRFRAWLYAVARSECLRRLRSSRVKAAMDEGPRLRRAAEVLSTGEQQQLRALLSVAFGGLERAERDIMQMVWHGLDLAEVAAVLGIPRTEAYVLFAGARDQLESSVGVLLMGWSGRVDCGEFQAMLAGHDRRLTADLRTRLCRHIDKCGICAERYRQEMRPSLLLGLSIGALLSEAGGARATPSRAPRGLWQEVHRMTSERHPDAVWHRLIGGRRVSFDANGFPRQLSDDGTNRAPRVAFAAVGTMAVAVTATGVATHAHHTATSATGSPSIAAVSSDVTTPAQAPGTSHATAAGKGTHRVVTHGTAASQPRALTPSVTPSSMPTLGSSAVGVSGRGASPTHSTATASPTGGTASGSSSPSQPQNGGSSSGSPSGSPSPSQSQTGGSSGEPSSSPSSSPSSTTAGTLSVSTSNIALAVGGSGSFTLTANGGPVTWSISAPRQLLADVSLSQSSGTLEAGQSVTITVTVAGLAAIHESLTISPGGQTVTVDVALL
jgi:RNA polymerase sigma factor (sigma-70 family)